MKNKNLIIIAVVVILLLVGGLFFSMKKSPQPVSQMPTSENATTATNKTNNSLYNGNKAEEIEGTLKSLLAAGKSVSCSFNNNDKDIVMSGTVYAANGKVREDYQADTSAGKMTGHMIVESPDAYMWTDQMAQGFKFSIEGQPTPAAQSNNNRPDINKAMHFSCQPWSADNNVFTLPTNINFQTMSVPNIPQNSNAGAAGTENTNASNQCAVCNNIPAGAARDTCKQQLKCP